MFLRSYSVRHKFPLRASYFRQVLPPVRGFPTLRVLCLIRHLMGSRRAFPLTVFLRLPARLSLPPFRFRYGSVSGFPLPCLNNHIPYSSLSHRQEPLGLPKFFDASLPACHGLWTPADLPILALTDDLVLPSVTVNTLGIRNNPFFEAVPALQEARSSLRPAGFSAYASPVLFADSLCRLRHRRKTRYGWVASPYPTGTFTLQDTPSLSWRDNAAADQRQADPRARSRGRLAAAAA